MSKTKAGKWHDEVFERAKGYCEAEQHDRGCYGRAEHAHHIVYRSHLTKDAMWILDNGAALSLYCHAMAHRTHNANISQERLDRAVDAVNAIMPNYLQRPYFRRKAA
jgi:hypothetical protein